MIPGRLNEVGVMYKTNQYKRKQKSLAWRLIPYSEFVEQGPKTLWQLRQEEKELRPEVHADWWPEYEDLRQTNIKREAFHSR